MMYLGGDYIRKDTASHLSHRLKPYQLLSTLSTLSYIKSVQENISECITSHILLSPLSQLFSQIASTIMKTFSSLLSLLLFPLFVLASPTLIIARQDFTIENGLTTDPCKALTLIFAGGTNEPGNVSDVVGPPLFPALLSDLGTDQVIVQGVDYSTGILG
jgi:hypothetical protein